MAMKEVDYYPEITEFFKNEIQANLDCYPDVKLKAYFAHTLTLEKGLSKIIIENHLSIKKLTEFAEKAPPLFLDIFGVITDGTNIELVILEIKLKPSVGLTELSQLVGYSMVSSSTYGFLIDVNGQPSQYLRDILATNKEVTDIVTDYNGDIQHHYFNVMEWDSDSKNIRYTTYGQINTISKLCEHLHEDFVAMSLMDLI